MDGHRLIEKMQDIISSCTERTAKNNPAALTGPGNAFSVNLQALKAALTGHAEVKSMLGQFKNHMRGFERALKNNKRDQTTVALEDMKRTVHSLKTATPVT